MEQAAATRASFTGTPGKFFGIAWRGGLLQIPTFGFYRFWLITEARRYLWSNTRIGDEGLEYTGQARQILVGFLIAVGILLPIYLGYFLIGLEAERAQAFASLPLVLIFYVLFQYASYRARRYRLSHTSFRGLRFSMTGSGWAYAARAIGWDILTGLSFGLALPWREASLERYRLRHTHFGSLTGDFAATGGALFKRAGWLWLVALAGFGGLGLWLAYGTMQQFAATKQGLTANVSATAPALFMIFCLVFGVVALPLYKAIQLRWRLSGMRMGEVALDSDLPKGRVVWAYLKAAAAIFLLLIVFGFAISLLVWIAQPSLVELNSGRLPLGLMAAIAALYLLFLVCSNILLMRLLTYNLWAAAAGSLTVANIAALDAAAAGGAPADQLGDGIADAFDFGGIGI